MRKLLCLLLVFLLLTGCSKAKEEEATILVESNTGKYTYLLPFTSTDTRNYHSTYQSRYDLVEIGSGMEKYSLDYFNSADFYATEGQIVTRTELSSLVGRESTSNIQGLNPAKGSFFAVNDRNQVEDAVIVTDVMEIDFVKKDDPNSAIAGATFAITVNERQTANNNGYEVSYTIDSERLWDYATNAGRKLESYLRTLSSVQDIPILILIYNTASSDASLPGGFTGVGYFTGRSGQFNRLENRWVLIPTTEANNKDPETYQQFMAFKSSLKNYLPENISIIGQGQYENEELTYLKLDVKVQSKTYAEVKSLTQYCALLCSNFDNLNIRLVIHVFSNSETFALVHREVGNENVNITYLY